MNVDVQLLAELSMLSFEGGNLLGEAETKKELEELITDLQLPENPSWKPALSKDNVMPLRKDEVVPSLKRDEILLNAPQKQAGCFVVPKTV